MTSARKARRNVGRRHGGKARLTRTRERIRTRGARNARKTRNDCVTIAFVITAGYRRRCCRHVILKRRRTNVCSARDGFIFSLRPSALSDYIFLRPRRSTYIFHTQARRVPRGPGARVLPVFVLFFLFFFFYNAARKRFVCAPTIARVCHKDVKQTFLTVQTVRPVTVGRSFRRRDRRVWFSLPSRPSAAAFVAVGLYCHSSQPSSVPQRFLFTEISNRFL